MYISMMEFEEFKTLVAEKFSKSPEEITAETTIMEDLGADSLDIVDLLMTLEDDYGVVIPDEEAQELRTIGEVYEYFK